MHADPLTDHSMDEAAIDCLAFAHTRTVDALAGYEKMVEKAEPGFLSVATRFRDLHAAHAASLAAMLRQQGRAPDAEGSFMARVNRMVVATRAFFDEIDADVMSQVRSGEEHVLAAYRAAESGVPYPVVKSLVAGMRTELQALLAETRQVG